jgi:hypothetical protein
MRNQTGYTPAPSVPGTPPTGPAGASSARANCSAAADATEPNNSAPSEPPDEGEDDDVHCEAGRRDRFRTVLRPFADPDDDTIPAYQDSGGYRWVPVESVLDQLEAAVGTPARLT